MRAVWKGCILAGVLCLILSASLAVWGQRTILLMVAYTDRDEEYAHVRDILQSKVPNVVLTELTSDSAADVEAALRAADAFLVPEQEDASGDQVFQLGQAWAGALQAFVHRGGMIIELVGYTAGKGVELLRGAGLTSAQDVQQHVGVDLRVVAPSHYLAGGVPGTFVGMDGTISFGQFDGDPVIATADGRPVVFEKHVGSGSLVAIGFDYYEYNDAMAQVLVNAVGAATVDVGVDERKEVAADVIREVLKDDLSGKEVYVSSRPLAAGSTVKTWTGEVRTTSSQEWMVFVDDLPKANWGHPARYVFQDVVTGARRVIQALLPPLEFQVLLRIEIVIDPTTGRGSVTFTEPGKGLPPSAPEELRLTCDAPPTDLTLEFVQASQVLSYNVVTDPGRTLAVSVADLGSAGDTWIAEVYEDGTLVASTRGDGTLESYSLPTAATLRTGRASVRVRYAGGIDLWPAHMALRIACSEPTGTGVSLSCGGAPYEETYRFQGATDALVYDVSLDLGATLYARVADAGMPGDIWRVDVFSGGVLVASTQGDGTAEWSPQPAAAAIPSGRAVVRVTYERGVDVWPATMRVQMECRRGPSPPITPPVTPPITPPVTPPTGQGRKVALLVSGGGNKASNYDRYWNDMSFMYRTLKTRYGYTDEDIYVLYADGLDTAVDQRSREGYADSPKDFDGDGKADIDRPATRQDLLATFSDLRGRLTDRDQLFFFSTNHGSQDPEGTSDAVLVLFNNEVITDDEFAQAAKGLRVRSGAYFFEQCFSGGFIEEMRQTNHIVMTAADWNEPSWACDSEGAYNELCYYFMSALAGKTPAGDAVNADANGDGVVTMREAFEYAKSKDSQTDEHPQYYEGTGGLGSNTRL